MGESKMFFSEASGDSNDKLKSLPPRIKEALEKLRKEQDGAVGKSESNYEKEEPNIDANMAQLHQMVRVIEESFFKLVLDELTKKDAPESDIEKLKNDYKEYAECWDKAFVEKGEKLSITRDVYPRLSLNNIWFHYSQRITEKYFGIERN